MKYYFPTSSLNFEAIISSLCIMPESYYRDGAVGFSRYTKSEVDISEDFAILYSCPVLWDIDSAGTVNYPMLVEIDDEQGLSELGESREIEKGIRYFPVSEPYYFSTDDILRGNVRFLFRSCEECRLISDRARHSVAECKVFCIGESACGRMFGLVSDAGDALPFRKIKPWVGHPDITTEERKSKWNAYVVKDRTQGAELGFRTGRWIRSWSESWYIDALREQTNFDLWRKTLTPEVDAILDMLCSDVSFIWNVNRQHVVDFCARCWNECLSKSRDEGRHEVLRCIARSVAETTYQYPIGSIVDDEMQAFACFVTAGRRESTLINMIKTEKVRLPELALALYGGLVGYSLFSRSLLDRRSFEDDVSEEDVVRKDEVEKSSTKRRPVRPNPENSVAPQSSFVVPAWAKSIWEKVSVILGKQKTSKAKRLEQTNDFRKAIKGSSSEEELIASLSQYKNWSKRTKAYRELLAMTANQSREATLFDAIQDQDCHEKHAPVLEESHKSLMVEDESLADVFWAFLEASVHINPSWRESMIRNVRWFQNEYAPGGQYADKPRDNNNTIQHLVNLTAKKLSIPKWAEERKSMLDFLQGRYK